MSEAIQNLEDMRETVAGMQGVKGSKAVINKIKSSILFLQMHRVDKKTVDLIIKAREKDIEDLNRQEYKQVEIDWRSPRNLRGGGVKPETD